ncbi:hypothetical protein BC938DRAFT_473982 [Jimgerdemannia flammicorona]|uniref:Uncharacterized protein n=1 Tax=Jimgerdemannia flammicorona TaxID=994334 RepID=A0A433Q336_9FUNG|nr:hypothetical protein BC938DRAFT_473982 [Jimgerdemannia flammicorona]
MRKRRRRGDLRGVLGGRLRGLYSDARPQFCPRAYIAHTTFVLARTSNVAEIPNRPLLPFVFVFFYFLFFLARLYEQQRQCHDHRSNLS